MRGIIGDRYIGRSWCTSFERSHNTEVSIRSTGRIAQPRDSSNEFFSSKTMLLTMSSNVRMMMRSCKRRMNCNCGRKAKNLNSKNMFVFVFQPSIDPIFFLNSYVKLRRRNSTNWWKHSKKKTGNENRCFKKKWGRNPSRRRITRSFRWKNMGN